MARIHTITFAAGFAAFSACPLLSSDRTLIAALRSCGSARTSEVDPANSGVALSKVKSLNDALVEMT